jgi:hypothetical protein
MGGGLYTLYMFVVGCRCRKDMPIMSSGGIDNYLSASDGMQVLTRVTL